MAELKKSENTFKVMGTLKETNIEIVTEKRKIFYGEGKSKEVECRVAKKKDFKNPAFLIDVNGKDVEVDMHKIKYGIPEITLDDNGNVITGKDGKPEVSKWFKPVITSLGFKALVDCKEGETPDRVEAPGFVANNEYANQEDWVSHPLVTTYGLGTKNLTEDNQAEGRITGIIRNISHEVRMENEEEVETGRLKVEFYYLDYSKNAFPITFFVEEGISSAFEDAYNNGDCCEISYEVGFKTVGATKPVTKGLGDRQAKVNSGYTIKEFVAFNASAEPFDEESPLFISVEDMKELVNTRKLMIETKIEDTKNKEKNKESESKSSPKGASKGIGRREARDTGDSPF